MMMRKLLPFHSSKSDAPKTTGAPSAQIAVNQEVAILASKLLQIPGTSFLIGPLSPHSIRIQTIVLGGHQRSMYYTPVIRGQCHPSESELHLNSGLTLPYQRSDELQSSTVKEADAQPVVVNERLKRKPDDCRGSVGEATLSSEGRRHPSDASKKSRS
jgi:hypothetical protein